MSTARKLLQETTRRGALLAAVVAIVAAKSARGHAEEARSSPFFPIGLYSVDNPKDFPEVTRAGFNLIQSYRFEGIPPWGKILQEGNRIPWQSSGGSFDAKWPPYGVYIFEIR